MRGKGIDMVLVFVATVLLNGCHELLAYQPTAPDARPPDARPPDAGTDATDDARRNAAEGCYGGSLAGSPWQVLDENVVWASWSAEAAGVLAEPGPGEGATATAAIKHELGPLSQLARFRAQMEVIPQPGAPNSGSYYAGPGILLRKPGSVAAEISDGIWCAVYSLDGEWSLRLGLCDRVMQDCMTNKASPPLAVFDPTAPVELALEVADGLVSCSLKQGTTSAATLPIAMTDVHPAAAPLDLVALYTYGATALFLFAEICPLD